MSALLLLGLACAHREAAAPVQAAAPAEAAAPLAARPSVQAIYRALSVRDPAPDCVTVEALSDQPVPDLLQIVDHASQPPWAGMRAANCLIQGHGAEIQAQLSDWVRRDDTRGLAILVLDQLDTLPEDLALDLARQALAGPWAADARPRLDTSSRPALHALAD